MSFAPLSSATPQQLAAAANAALRAETHNTGRFEVAAAASGLTLKDPRFGAGRLVVLIPLNTAAANAPWYMSSMRKGEADIVFTVVPSSAAEFAYIIAGFGTPTPRS